MIIRKAGGDFAEFSRDCLKVFGNRPLIFFGREVPIWWLWHPDRLLPAVIAATLKYIGLSDQLPEILRITPAGDVWLKGKCPADVIERLQCILALAQESNGEIILNTICHHLLGVLASKDGSATLKWVKRVRLNVYWDRELTDDPIEIGKGLRLHSGISKWGDCTKRKNFRDWIRAAC